MKQCKFCLMDDTAPEISFDKKGVCNFCYQAQNSLLEIEKEKVNLLSMLEQIKLDGVGKDYDCLMGLSGGLDSSTTIDWAVQQGLRVLCFTLDNQYNTEEADHNVKALVKKLGLEHKVITIDQDKYTELQDAFFKAGVRNCEIPTDHILMAVSLRLAKENDIKWILSGGNTVSESIMPASWGYQPRDLTHIKAIYRAAGYGELTGLPTCSIWEWNHYKWEDGIKTFYPLDYIDYNLEEAKKMLSEKYGWRDYGLKHEESIFTGWFQNKFLPERWGIDKRKAHLSSLINAGQLTREEGLAILAKPAKKFDFPIFTLSEIEIMSYPKHEHSDYAQETWYEDIAKIIKSKKYV